jgi:ABC-type Na+ efflux pump permease subunit
MEYCPKPERIYPIVKFFVGLNETTADIVAVFIALFNMKTAAAVSKNERRTMLDGLTKFASSSRDSAEKSCFSRYKMLRNLRQGEQSGVEGNERIYILSTMKQF